jgi:ubiquinone/menaquinone biosynthesis C-methylase UbiE
MKKYDFSVADVSEVYDGAGAVLWEALMGEFIHVGGEPHTKVLAEKAGVTKDSYVLDVCSAVGAPSRWLAKTFGCKVEGLDATVNMINEANRRAKEAGLDNLVSYSRGSALDMPYRANTFDIVWGEDAWCYVTDKDRLIAECARVLKPGGTLAFTDWLEVGPMDPALRDRVYEFMVFPSMESIDGYNALIKKHGLQLVSSEDLCKDFAEHMLVYEKKMKEELKPVVVQNYGAELYAACEKGIEDWVQASKIGGVGRARFIAKKPR